MVKISGKRVVVVESPDKRFFDQAIFIVGEKARGVTSWELLEEARRVAKGYATAGKHRESKILMPLFWTSLGGTVMGLAWLVTMMIR